MWESWWYLYNDFGTLLPQWWYETADLELVFRKFHERSDVQVKYPEAEVLDVFLVIYMDINQDIKPYDAADANDFELLLDFDEMTDQELQSFLIDATAKLEKWDKPYRVLYTSFWETQRELRKAQDTENSGTE